MVSPDPRTANTVRWQEQDASYSWLAYDTARKFSKEKKKFGKGSVEGVVAAECANNACIGGALVPLLTLGVPGSPPAAAPVPSR